MAEEIDIVDKLGSIVSERAADDHISLVCTEAQETIQSLRKRLSNVSQRNTPPRGVNLSMIPPK